MLVAVAVDEVLLSLFPPTATADVRAATPKMPRPTDPAPRPPRPAAPAPPRPAPPPPAPAAPPVLIAAPPPLAPASCANPVPADASIAAVATIRSLFMVLTPSGWEIKSSLISRTESAALQVVLFKL
ncbi:hypothetical protein DKT77_10735 [Meridianimarinicoccus roseus]|uniref:Uncharacterized protein n=1 Tax=Meridianimarinicoccus roseus TaxID=2072018 RepID=A0A2V2LHM5_9RHOB|nr:hypothetical protein DKT77_10735 [Meridianimarinicoccus roseus]